MLERKLVLFLFVWIKQILYNLHQNFYRRNMIEIAFKIQNMILDLALMCARIILRQNKLLFHLALSYRSKFNFLFNI